MMTRYLSILMVALALSANGAQTITNVFLGTNPNDQTGDTLRVAFNKLNVNDNWLLASIVASTNGISAGITATNTPSAGQVLKSDGSIYYWDNDLTGTNGASVVSFNGRSDVVTLLRSDVTNVLTGTITNSTTGNAATATEASHATMADNALQSDSSTYVTGNAGAPLTNSITGNASHATVASYVSGTLTNNTTGSAASATSATTAMYVIQDPLTNQVYGSKVSGAVPSATTATYVTGNSATLTNKVYGSNIVGLATSSGVTSFNTRTGSVTLATSDITALGTLENDTSGNATTATTADKAGTLQGFPAVISGSLVGGPSASPGTYNWGISDTGVASLNGSGITNLVEPTLQSFGATNYTFLYWDGESFSWATPTSDHVINALGFTPLSATYTPQASWLAPSPGSIAEDGAWLTRGATDDDPLLWSTNMPVTRLTGITGTPDGTKFLRDDFTWAAPTATVGDVSTMTTLDPLSNSVNWFQNTGGVFYLGDVDRTGNITATVVGAGGGGGANLTLNSNDTGATFNGNVSAAGYKVGTDAGITSTITLYTRTENGSGVVTNTITIQGGIITGWTQ